MSFRRISYPAYSRPKTVTFLVVAISLIVTQTIAWRLFLRELSLEHHQVENEVIQFKNHLETLLEYSSTATYTLAFLIQNDLLEDDFDSLSEQLLRQNRYIDAMQLLEGTVITKTFPLVGNEEAIGLNLAEMPQHKVDIRRTIEKRALHFEGPFKLAQGGEGFVGRLPIFKNEKLWGFSAVVIHSETLLKGLDLHKSGIEEDFVYQIFKRDQDNSDGWFENLEVFTTGISTHEYMPLGDWNLYVKMRNPRHWAQSVPFAFLGVIFSFLLGIITWKVITQPAKLQRLIDEKTTDLVKLNVVLEKRADELEQYAHVISHDLQEPLRMVVSFLQLLERGYADELDEHAKEYIRHASNSAVRMRQLIRDLLEYSVAGKNKAVLEKVPLRMVLDDVTSLLHAEIESSGAVIEYDDLPLVRALKIPLTQVMQNLVSNAIKYVKHGETPKIHISSRDSGSFWEIIVKDHGIGIAEDHHYDIFKVFKRLHDSSEYSGTGIGLAIVKKNIESMGGDIWVESYPGEGSEFHFILQKVLQKI